MFLLEQKDKLMLFQNNRMLTMLKTNNFLFFWFVTAKRFLHMKLEA